ncbi:hypothetical protein Golax_004639 [Gossypium laxum]|uniref:Transcription repressor n=1 Tax=Gossypium laxum TaxID=34288 RepID=A0A7J9AY83_9ROSI|nr:hypothetical protein [Gossypium laxum]
MKLPALFKPKEPTSKQQWQWPSCKHPKTLSFRAGDDVFKTVNSMFFDPNTNNDSGVETPQSCVILAMESDDPYVDFRKSMEEMVETHGMKDWEWLEQLLGWYLKVNGKNNHGFIIGAFIDLLVAITSSSDSTSYSSALSSFPSSPLCSTEGDVDEFQLQQNIVLP